MVIGRRKKHLETLDEKETLHALKGLDEKNNSTNQNTLDDNAVDAPEEVKPWKERLLTLLQNMPPDTFERLMQRLLRESGFLEVEVTDKTGDGGIGGKGIYKIGGLISFNVVFQCKRQKGTVASDEIRNFRGALQGKSDTGLFVTTGTFTRDAIQEASRDGAWPIDLLDGQQLVNQQPRRKRRGMLFS